MSKLVLSECRCDWFICGRRAARGLPGRAAAWLVALAASGCGDGGALEADRDAEPRHRESEPRRLDAASGGTGNDARTGGAAGDGDTIPDAPEDALPAVDRRSPPDGSAAADATVDARSDAGPPYDGPHFTDVTVAAGLDYVQGQPLPPAECNLFTVTTCGPEFTGGAAAGDFDGDGLLDLYVTRFDATDILFRNRGDGTFEDATVAAGLTLNLPSNGAAWGDIDNDGDLDLYVTIVGDLRHYLFVNDGSGRFTEEAVARGAALEGIDVHQGFGIAFGDYDLDGWLDLYVTDWRLTSLVSPGARSYNRLLRNLGAVSPGRFEDVSQNAAVSMDGLHVDGAWGFAPSFSDLDGDGWPDLTVTGDFQTSRLFWNNGDGTFTDGTDAARVNTEQNGMGSTIGDYDGDGLLDWFVTAIYCDDSECGLGATGNRLYRNNGDRTFSDHTDLAGVRNGRWGWGAAFFDYDNDGDLDLVMTNGVDFPESLADPFRADRMRLWRNDGAGTMTEVALAAGMTDQGSGRGLLVFDYDADGDEDVFVARHADRPILYRNDGGNAGDFIRLRLEGTRANRSGIGARVLLTAVAGGPALVREVRAGSDFLGQSETIVHIGLGAGSGPVSEVRIRWPGSPTEQVLTDVPRRSVLDVLEP